MDKRHTQIRMPIVGFEPTIPVFERSNTFHISDPVVTVVGQNCYLKSKYETSDTKKKKNIDVNGPEIYNLDFTDKPLDKTHSPSFSDCFICIISCEIRTQKYNLYLLVNLPNIFQFAPKGYFQVDI
jgi:hypothetical protein